MTKPKADETAYLWQNIPKALWTRARGKALAEGVTMKDVLKQLVQNWLEEPRAETRTPDQDPAVDDGSDVATP